jgi:hypothetical protein
MTCYFLVLLHFLPGLFCRSLYTARSTSKICVLFSSLQVPPTQRRLANEGTVCVLQVGGSQRRGIHHDYWDPELLLRVYWVLSAITSPVKWVIFRLFCTWWSKEQIGLLFTSLCKSGFEMKLDFSNPDPMVFLCVPHCLRKGCRPC